MRPLKFAAAIALPLACGAPATRPSGPLGAALSTMTLSSRSFPKNGSIPIDNSCDGANRSPHLTWSAPPRGTASFAIVMDDADAPSGAFTQFVVYDLPGTALSLAEGADLDEVGAVAGTGDSLRSGYSGPCPPSLEMHHYVFRVYALDKTLSLGPGARRDMVEAAMNGHVLAEGVLVGIFAH